MLYGSSGISKVDQLAQNLKKSIGVIARQRTGSEYSQMKNQGSIDIENYQDILKRF